MEKKTSMEEKTKQIERENSVHKWRKIHVMALQPIQCANRKGIVYKIYMANKLEQ